MQRIDKLSSVADFIDKFVECAFLYMPLIVLVILLIYFIFKNKLNTKQIFFLTILPNIFTLIVFIMLLATTYNYYGSSVFDKIRSLVWMTIVWPNGIPALSFSALVMKKRWYNIYVCALAWILFCVLPSWLTYELRHLD